MKTMYIKTKRKRSMPDGLLKNNSVYEVSCIVQDKGMLISGVAVNLAFEDDKPSNFDSDFFRLSSLTY